MEEVYQGAVAKLLSGEVKDAESLWWAVSDLHFKLPWVKEELRQYHPDDIGCIIFGLSCPAFFVACRTGAEMLSLQPQLSMPALSWVPGFVQHLGNVAAWLLELIDLHQLICVCGMYAIASLWCPSSPR